MYSKLRVVYKIIAACGIFLMLGAYYTSQKYPYVRPDFFSEKFVDWQDRHIWHNQYVNAESWWLRRALSGWERAIWVATSLDEITTKSENCQNVDYKERKNNTDLAIYFSTYTIFGIRIAQYRSTCANQIFQNLSRSETFHSAWYEKPHSPWFIPRP